MKKINKKISVVIPCFNERENINNMYGRLSQVLQNITSDYEIVFVDNNSTDGSKNLFEILAEKDKRVSVLFFSRNFGNSQYGYSAGAEYATGEAVIWIEGDLQDPPEAIEKLVEKWVAGYDVVYGLRPKAVGGPFMRFARRTFYQLFHQLSYLDIPKDAGDFSLMDRKVVDILTAMPERSRFVRGLRAWVGFKHIGVQYERSKRHAGTSSNPGIMRNIWWAKKFIFSFSYAPLEFVSVLAGISVFCSLIMTIVFIALSLSGNISVVVAVIGGIIFWLFTFIMVILVILAESMSIIFEEVKRRPKYIISRILNDHRR